MTDDKDIVARLKDAANGIWHLHQLGDYGICDEAAARIEADAATIAALRDALRAAYDDTPGWCDLARQALRSNSIAARAYVESAS